MGKKTFVCSVCTTNKFLIRSEKKPTKRNLLQRQKKRARLKDVFTNVYEW